MAKKKTTKIDQKIIRSHDLSQEHVKLNEKDKKVVLTKYNATIKELPKILKTDPALKGMDVKAGDVIKIVRASRTRGTSEFYRGVIDG